MILLENFWYFGKVVANERWSLTRGVAKRGSTVLRSLIAGRKLSGIGFLLKGKLHVKA